MSEPKWTPGPWTAESVFGLFYRIYASGPAGQVNVARTLERPPFIVRSDNPPLYPTDTETEANAHLIAAAPRLYRALEAIAELDDGDQRFVWQHPEEFEEAHAALAKARGQSK